MVKMAKNNKLNIVIINTLSANVLIFKYVVTEIGKHSLVGLIHYF